MLKKEDFRKHEREVFGSAGKEHVFIYDFDLNEELFISITHYVDRGAHRGSFFWPLAK